MKSANKAPAAKQVPKTITQHGEKRIDNYAWLRDENWQEFLQGNLEFADSDVEAYVAAENRYTDEGMKDTETLQKELFETLVSRTKEDDKEPPMRHGEYFYYSRIEKGRDYEFHCRRKGSMDAPEEIFLDENIEAEGKGYYSLAVSSPSKGDRYLLLAENNTGSMEYSVRIKDLEKDEFLPWTVKDTNGSVTWCGDYEHIYYVERHPVNGRGLKVFRMNIHEGPSSKELVFEKPESLSNLFMNVFSSADDDYIFIELGDTNSNEIHYLDGKDPGAAPKLFWGLKRDTLVQVDYAQGNFYILSNEDGMVNNQLFTCKPDAIERGTWEVVLEHESTRFLESMHLYKDYLVFETTDNEKALPDLVVLGMKDGKRYSVTMKDAAYCIGFLGAMEYESPTVQFSYQSPVTPREVQELTLSNGKTSVIQKGECPNYDQAKYQVERLFVDAHDGAKIPLTVVSKKDFKRDGQAPHYQYAYGSYGISIPAGFSPNTFALIDKGFSFSIAHIRGGADKGYQWYLDGKMNKKLNSFKDYISCTKYLIENGYSSKGKITANGGSAGGMLMGGIANMAPELYNSVILDVPFVDVINTISDETLPLTPPEWNEWGNPIESKESYDYMMSYSPYDNVTAQNYPHMLFNSGITDEQVTYWEPAKMVAKLRELKTDENMLFLKIKMTAGHAGSSARYKALKEKAFSFAFALKAQGMV